MTEFSSTVTSLDALREHYRQPHDLVVRKKADRLDAAARGFLAASPFCLLATADADGRCDVSPRGGPPGFVRALDEHRVVLPDLSGNNLLDSLTNIVANGHVALLVVVPGRDETLRIEGTACLTTDPDVLALWDGELRRPKLAVGLTVTTTYVHCAKAFRRGGVWNPTSWAALDAPDACDVLIEQSGLDVDAPTVRDALEQGYAHDLAAERP
jgi:hypothetical protein